MKINLKKITCFHSGNDQHNVFLRTIPGVCRIAMLILLVIALAACNLPQKKTLTGAQTGRIATGLTTTPALQPVAGEAVLTIERNYEYYDPNGSDLHHELGVVKLVFSPSEEGPLLVQGTGKSQWDEIAQFPVCGYTATAKAALTVTGLFLLDDCMFHLSISKKFSQPTTSNQAADCSFPLHFTQTEFSKNILLDPDSPLILETKNPGPPGWFEIETFTISDLKSDVIKNCFKPEVIRHSTQTP